MAKELRSRRGTPIDSEDERRDFLASAARQAPAPPG